MNIPQSNMLPTEKLGAVFNNTVATYKFYWFLSILDIVVIKGKTKICIWEIVANMISLAWYPIHYFRLSFGKQDSFEKQIEDIREYSGLTIDCRREQIVEYLLSDEDKKAKQRLMRVFVQNVPYRFLMPWLQTSDDRYTIELSQSFTNDCLYAITQEGRDKYVTINPAWVEYLQKNYIVLHDFAYWNLTNFIQVRNPNVPNIPSKLIKPIERESLSKQHQFWDMVLREQGGIHCIYTNELLTAGNYDLDHFIPWSFVTHDQLWNLMPSDGSINSSKSNRLPNLDQYMKPLAMEHQKAVRIAYERNQSNKLLEDYLNIVDSIESLVNMDEEHLLDTFNRTFRPMVQIASNMNFEMWNYKNQ